MISSNSIRGFIDLMVLILLEQKDMYGYEISKEIYNKTDKLYEVNEATLYAVLNRLESKKAITSYQGELSHGNKRKYFKISTFGKTYLLELKQNYLSTKEVIDKFMEAS